MIGEEHKEHVALSGTAEYQGVFLLRPTISEISDWHGSLHGLLVQAHCFANTCLLGQTSKIFHLEYTLALVVQVGAWLLVANKTCNPVAIRLEWRLGVYRLASTGYHLAYKQM